MCNSSLGSVVTSASSLETERRVLPAASPTPLVSRQVPGRSSQTRITPFKRVNPLVCGRECGLARERPAFARGLREAPHVARGRRVSG